MSRHSRFFLFAVLLSLFPTVSCDRPGDKNSPQPGDPAVQPDPETAAAVASPPSSPPTAEQKRLQQNLGNLLSDMAARQAKGLGGGTVRVNGAWIYKGYSHLAPNPDSPIPAHLVAVDVTIEGHTADFDIDDIEIVDGASLVSYASDPHFTLLDTDGEPAESGVDLPPVPLPIRALLIYAFPVGSPTFKLYYWGKDLLPEPREFAKEGWGLPYPAEPVNGEQ